jgi:hypothetical protein
VTTAKSAPSIPKSRRRGLQFGATTVHRRNLRLLVLLLAVLFAPVLAVALLVGWIALSPPAYVSKTHDFRNELQRAVSPSELRTWALTEISRADGRRVELSKVPQFLGSLRDGPPRYLTVETAGPSGESYVFVVWGGGFARWGIKAGSTTFQAKDDAQNYHLEWEPGLCVWHEIQ